MLLLSNQGKKKKRNHSATNTLSKTRWHREGKKQTNVNTSHQILSLALKTERGKGIRTTEARAFLIEIKIERPKLSFSIQIRAQYCHIAEGGEKKKKKKKGTGSA